MEVPEATSDAEVLAGWESAGVVIVRSVFGAALCASVAEACDRAVDAAAATGSQEWRYRFKSGVDDAVVLDRLDPVRDFVPEAVPLLDDPRLLAWAELLTGSPMAMYKDKYIAKRPGTAGYGIHQDAAYTWQLGVKPSDMVQVQIALGAHGEHNGAVEVAPGWHHELFTTPGKNESIEPGVIPEASFGPLTVAPGDVVLMHYLCPHRSPSNTGEVGRPLLAPSFARGGPEVWDRYYGSYARRAEEETSELLG